MGVQILDVDGKRIAVLPAEEYEGLVAQIEDHGDILAAERAEKRRDEGEETVPFTVIKRIMDGEHPLRVWREHRGLSVEALAQTADVNRQTIYKIEKNIMVGSPRLLQKLANVLDLMIDDIMPESDPS